MTGVARYLLGRALQAVLTLIAVSMVTFLMLHMLPGNLPMEMLGRSASPSQVRQLTQALGLDLPFPVQYVRWLLMLFLPGNLRAVASLTIPTLELLVVSGGIALVAALGIASVQARLRGSLVDRLLGVLSYVVYTLPSFWVGLMLLWVFADELLWLPATGPQPTPPTMGLLDWPLHMILPVLTMVLATIASWSSEFRAAIEEALRSDYVRTARAKGLGEGLILRRHALRPAALPVITIVGMSLPTMFNNVVAVEIVFVMSGLGSALVGMIGGLQYGVSGYLVLAIAAVTLMGTLCADILYAVADPRIQFSS